MEGILKPLIDAGLYDPSQAYPGGGQIDDMDKWNGKLLMRKIMNFKYISLIAIAASLIGCTKNGEMDEDFLADGPAFSADFLQQSVQTKVTHTDDGNALKLAWEKSDK